MRIGLMISAPGLRTDLAGVLAAVEQAEADGFSAVWVPSVRSYDALMTLALAGQRTGRIELGTFLTTKRATPLPFEQTAPCAPG